MKRINKKIIKSKLLIMMFSVIFLLVALMVNAFSSFAMSSSGTDKWVAGQWDSGIYTTKMTEGMFLRRLVNYTTGEQYTTFCSQFLVESPVGIIESAVSSRPSDSKVKDACKIAYLGWYSKYGNYVINGSTMSDRGKVLDFVFTQQFIWETLGQEPGELRDSKIQQDYETFKSDIKQKMK